MTTTDTNKAVQDRCEFPHGTPAPHLEALTTAHTLEAIANRLRQGRDLGYVSLTIHPDPRDAPHIAALLGLDHVRICADTAWWSTHPTPRIDITVFGDPDITTIT